MPLACPRCAAPTAARTFADFTAEHYCEPCERLWLPKGRLAEIAIRPSDFADIAAARAAGHATPLLCPSCPEMRLVEVPLTAGAATTVGLCESCEGISLSLSALSIARIGTVLGSAAPKLAIDPDRARWLLGLLAFPLAALIWTPLANALGLPAFLLRAAVVQLHEAGHAITAWLSGRMAVPLIGITFTDGGTSATSIFIFLTALFAWVSWRCGREKKYFVPAVCFLLFLLQCYLTLFISRERSQMWLVFGGCGGEMILGALLVLAFQHEMPEGMRWEYWRPAALLIGIYCFDHGYGFWRDVHSHRAQLPMGSLFGGLGDTQGDMNRLLGDFGWSEGHLINAYLLIGQLGSAILWLHYFAHAAIALRSSRSA